MLCRDLSSPWPPRGRETLVTRDTHLLSLYSLSLSPPPSVSLSGVLIQASLFTTLRKLVGSPRAARQPTSAPGTPSPLAVSFSLPELRLIKPTSRRNEWLKPCFSGVLLLFMGFLQSQRHCWNVFPFIYLGTVRLKQLSGNWGGLIELGFHGRVV